MALVSCPDCAELVDSLACVCPHCDTQLRVCRSRVHQAAGAALLGLALAGCDGPIGSPQPEYGVPFVDEDDDGFEEGDDCDDNDPDINPGADETAGDGIDSNCDGEDDPQ